MTSDSSGQSWTGRSLGSTGFDADDGAADARLMAELTASRGDASLVATIAASRLLVPVVARPAAVDVGSEPVTEKRTEMAAVTLVAGDGTRALPVFSGLETLHAWDPGARPVPVTASRAAQAALSESCHVLVVDPRSDHARELPSSMVWALAQGRTWIPPADDPVVGDALSRAVAAERDVLDHDLIEGDTAGSVTVVLRLRHGLPGTALNRVLERVGERLAGEPEVRIRLDALTFRIH